MKIQRNWDWRKASVLFWVAAAIALGWGTVFRDRNEHLVLLEKLLRSEGPIPSKWHHWLEPRRVGAWWALKNLPSDRSALRERCEDALMREGYFARRWIILKQHNIDGIWIERAKQAIQPLAEGPCDGLIARKDPISNGVRLTARPGRIDEMERRLRRLDDAGSGSSPFTGRSDVLR